MSDVIKLIADGIESGVSITTAEVGGYLLATNPDVYRALERDLVVARQAETIAGLREQVEASTAPAEETT